MKFISFIIGIVPYLVLAQIKTRQPVSGNLLQIFNVTGYYPSENQIGWNSSIYNQQQQSPGNTVYPTVPEFNYNTQTVAPGNGWNSANNAAYPTLQPFNYNTVSGSGWNSSNLNYRPAGNAQISSPFSTLPSFNYNTQTEPGNGWNSSNLNYRPAGNTQTSSQSFQTVPGIGWNSSATIYGQSGNNAQAMHQTGNIAYPTLAPLNYNTQPIQQSGNTAYPTFPPFNYNTMPGNGWNSANNNQSRNAAYPTTHTMQQSGNTVNPTFPGFNYNIQQQRPQQQQVAPQNSWNSSFLNYRPAGNAPMPSSTLPSFNYNTQMVPGNVWNSSVNSYRQSGINGAYSTVPALNFITQSIQQSGNTAYPTTQTMQQSGNTVYPTFPGFNYNTQQQQQQVTPQNRWNSSSLNRQLTNNAHQNLATTKLNNFNNMQTIPSKPIYVDRTVDFLNKTRFNIPSGICYTEVPTATLVSNRNSIPNGNGTTRAMSRIEICCQGYQRNPHVHSKCDPICKNDCPNGICTAPNTCICLPGNIRDHEDNCVPTCPIGCLNGNCQSDGSCVCKPGFILDSVSRQFCRPHCSKGCNYGKCVAPETCRCMPQYELAPLSGVCQPKCDNCDGTCTAPGVCVCKTGYIRKGSICEPVCTRGCSRGTCTAPETCTCKPGFVLDSSRANCIPHCDKPCLNGFCDGYNLCSCNPGYILENTLTNVCKAHCPSGCPNGTCTSPNFCICNRGFKKSGIKGQQICVPF